MKNTSIIQALVNHGTRTQSTGDTCSTSVLPRLPSLCYYVCSMQRCSGPSECRSRSRLSIVAHTTVSRMRKDSRPSRMKSKAFALGRLLTYPRLHYPVAHIVNYVWAAGPLGPNILLFIGFIYASLHCWANKYYFRPPFCTSLSCVCFPRADWYDRWEPSRRP